MLSYKGHVAIRQPQCKRVILVNFSKYLGFCNGWERGYKKFRQKEFELNASNMSNMSNKIFMHQCWVIVVQPRIQSGDVITRHQSNPCIPGFEKVKT